MKKTLLLLALLPVLALCSCNNPTSTSGQSEEVVPEPNYPNITERGVEPFFVGASLFDIPTHGDYYDAISVKRDYRLYFDGFDMGYFSNDAELEKAKDKYREEGMPIEIFAYVHAFITQGNDTLMRINCDKDALITSVLIKSSHFQTENGISIGMSSKELYENHKAIFLLKNSTFLEEVGEGDDHYDIQNMPKNIIVFPSCSDEIWDKIDKYLDENELRYMPDDKYGDYCPIPFDIVNGSTVSMIEIVNDSDN